MANNYPTLRQTFLIFGFLLLVSLLSIIILNLVEYFLFDINDSLINFLNYSIPTILTAFKYIKKKKLLNAEEYFIKTEKIDTWVYLQIFFLTILFIIVIDPINLLIPVPEWFSEIMQKMISKSLFSFTQVVLIAPVFEEIIFRGVILDGFLKIYSPKKSIIWSSILFGLIHLNPWQALGAFFIGLFIGWIYYRTQSIIPGILIHFTNNLIAFLLLLYSQNNALAFSDLFENKIIYLILIIIFSVIFYFGLKIFNKQLNKRFIGL
jgi:uncharacterized protein